MDLAKTQGQIHQQLQRSFTSKRLAHAYLFEGEPGTGKKEMADWLSQLVFCQHPTAEPCGTCLNCQRIATGEHPDVTRIEPDGQSIKVDQVREIKEVFMKSGFESRQKVLIISEAEKMTSSAANSLLKFIEEPDGVIIIIFITAAKGKILPTILSRCQVLHFLPLSLELVSQALNEAGFSASDAEFLAHLTRNTEKAIEISQEEWFNEIKEIAAKWLDYLLAKDPYSFVYVQQALVKNVNERSRQLLLFEMVLLKFRQLLTVELANKQLRPVQEGWTEKKLVKALELILASQQKLTANVSFQNVCEQLAIFLIEG